MVMERLGAASRHPQNQDQTKQFAIQQAGNILRAAGVTDPGPKEISKPEANQTEATLVINAEYPLTPELATQTFQTLWNVRGESVGFHFEVAPCPYTEEELKTLESQGKRVGFLPSEVSTQKTRHLLGKMFPQMQSHSVEEGNYVTNEEDRSGWFDYEADIDAPYTNTNEKQLNEKVKRDGRRLLTLNEYIAAGQDSKHFTGKYLDQNKTFVRLGSRNGGHVVDAGFDSGGGLDVYWSLRPDARNGGLGGRSSGVKKA